MRFDAVIFDFDGLMVDTETVAFEVWTAIYSRFGATLELEEWVQCVGAASGFDPVARLAELTQEPLDREALEQEKQRIKAERSKQLPLCSGVLDRLQEGESLGLKLAVASSSSRQWVHGHLRRHQLKDRFQSVATREDVVRAKPAPELYLETALRLDAAPERCLVFEDSQNGLRAALAAGMVCVIVPNPITAVCDFAGALAIYRSLADFTIAGLGRPPSQ